MSHEEEKLSNGADVAPLDNEDGGFASPWSHTRCCSFISVDISGTDQRKKRSCSRRPTVASVHRCEQKGTEQKMSRGQIKQTEVYSIMLENLTQRVSQVQKGSPVKTGKGPRWQQSSEIRPDQTGLESRQVGAQSWVLIHPGF